MKKYIFLISIISFLLPNLFGSLVKYEEALKLYNSKEYKKAYDAFKELALKEESNRLHFYLGRSAFELGEFKEALGFYEKVLLEDPENLRVRLEIAQTYLKLGEKTRAKDEFTYLLKEDMPKNIKEFIKNILKNLDSKKDYSFTNTLFFGLGYDDNIKSTTSDSYDIYIPQINQNVTVNPDEEVSGGVYEYGLVSNYSKKLEEDILLNTTLIGFSQNYFSNTLYNNELEVLSLSFTPTFLQKDAQFALKLGYDYMTYGHKSYLKTYTVSPSFSKKLNSSYLNTTTFKFLHKSFEQSENDYGNSSGSIIDDTQKDSRTYQLSNKLSYHSKETGITSLEIALGKESDLDNVRVDIDKRYISLAVSNLYPWTKKWSLNSLVSYNKTKYDNYDPNFQKYRSDDIYQISLGSSYKFSKSLLASLLYRYINRESNFRSYEYDKNLIKLSIQYKF